MRMRLSCALSIRKVRSGVLVMESLVDLHETTECKRNDVDCWPIDLAQGSKTRPHDALRLDRLARDTSSCLRTDYIGSAGSRDESRACELQHLETLPGA